MINPKNVLVVTTAQLDNITIKQYLKPVSAHIVAGTDLFSDVFASFSDVFGGRSKSYQKQITAIYNEAIEKIKYAAFEIGANCVVGLHVDMDEISGKGKSMFMVTAVGTAVIIEEDISKVQKQDTQAVDIVPVDRMKLLRKKKDLLANAEKDLLLLSDENWEFIISNHIVELYPFLLKIYSKTSLAETESTYFMDYHKQLVNYIDGFSEDEQLKLTYSVIQDADSGNEKLIHNLQVIIYELRLLNIEQAIKLVNSEHLIKRKAALNIITYDKPYYYKDDIPKLLTFKNHIETHFKERGTRSTKKQMLSSKEREVWICECDKTNDGAGLENEYCESCKKNIYGFKQDDITPSVAIKGIEEKIALISELVA